MTTLYYELPLYSRKLLLCLASIVATLLGDMGRWQDTLVKVQTSP